MFALKTGQGRDEVKLDDLGITDFTPWYGRVPKLRKSSKTVVFHGFQHFSPEQAVGVS